MGNSRGAGQRNHNDAIKTVVAMIANRSPDGKESKYDVKLDRDMVKHSPQKDLVIVSATG
jgi:hypothetical protein